jgi:16S rRNA (adenine1518-N6/adenine1519-N6)-dimethyltransferase
VIARHRLGQHFLSDPGILTRIADALAPAPADAVLEIGAGTGTLTAVLTPRVGRVIAIETDRRLAATLAERVRTTGDPVTVVVGDALRLDWHALLDSGAHATPGAPHAFKVVGNIPYNITTPLIDKALTPPWPERIVFLVQREVADRLAARPGSKAYGALTVGVQATCRVERLFVVSAGAFHPAPRVASALVRLTPRAEPLVGAGELGAFRAFVTACFTRRRKQLRNVVMGATGSSAARVTEALTALGIDPRARPETLAPEAFVRLLRWRDTLRDSSVP